MPNLIHSLTNPDKLRHNSVEVQDNPYSKYPMVIQSHADNLTSCLKYTGTKIHLKIWTPKTNNMNKSPHVMLSYINPWDTPTIEFPDISYYKKGETESSCNTDC